MKQMYDKETITREDLKFLEKQCPLTFSAPIVSAEFCATLMDEMSNLKQQIPIARLVSSVSLQSALTENAYANSQDYMGVVLRCLGMENMLEGLASLIIKCAKAFYRNMELRLSTALVVRYFGCLAFT
jgi:hypothetical protein